MKTPREILFRRHEAATPKLDVVRENSLTEITAKLATKTLRPRESFAVVLWRELFWAGRRVWIGFACVWLFIIVGNSLTSDSSRVVADAPRPNRAQILALQAQHQLLRQMLEQEPPPKPAAPDHHSDRHSRATFG